MATVVVLGVTGETDLWQVDLTAGTLSKLKAPATGTLADALKHRGETAAITKGVDFAVAVSSQSPVSSGELDGLRH